MNGSTENYHLQWYHSQSGEVLTYELNADAKLLTDHILERSQDSTLIKCTLITKERELPRVTIDEWDNKGGPCVTLYLEDCEYVGMLRLYKDEEGKVIE